MRTFGFICITLSVDFIIRGRIWDGLNNNQQLRRRKPRTSKFVHGDLLGKSIKRGIMNINCLILNPDDNGSVHIFRWPIREVPRPQMNNARNTSIHVPSQFINRRKVKHGLKSDGFKMPNMNWACPLRFSFWVKYANLALEVPFPKMKVPYAHTPVRNYTPSLA